MISREYAAVCISLRVSADWYYAEDWLVIAAGLLFLF